MTKGFLSVLFGALAACGGSVGGGAANTGGADGGGDAPGAIGSPCVPTIEGSSSFDGFDPAEVSLSSVPSSSKACLVYHFRGLVTCPYGQSATGAAPAGASPCTTSSGQPVVGAVEAQCTDRRPAEAVFWSCRCANTQGLTSDGYSYCGCPSGTACIQTITSIGAVEDDVSGAYCVPPGALGDGGLRCASSCDPATAPCP